MHAAGSVADLFNLDTTPVQLHPTTFQTGDTTGRGISSYLVRVLIWATRVVSTATNARVAVCLRCGCVLTGGDELSQDRFGDQCPQAVVVCWMGVARNTTGVSVSALVRYTKIQPITTTPDGILNRFTGASGIRCWTRCQVHGG